jgi:pyruvate formate lyase activating enzyme
MRQTVLQESLSGLRVRCLACARRCIIHPGQNGLCGVRTNSDGILKLNSYGRIAVGHADVIEKKPAYHYRPGSKLLSIGTVGCNWFCDFCINSELSQTNKIIGERHSVEGVVQLAKQNRCDGIAYTYNEPLIALEYAHDIGMAAHQNGLFNVIVSNGYGTAEAVDLLSEFADCVVVGLKANGSESFLRNHSRVPSSMPIFETLSNLKKNNIHIEISDLIIPTLGDSLEQAMAVSRWIVNTLGPDAPIHFVAYYPASRLSTIPMTPLDVLEAHCEVAANEGLKYVYVANFPGNEHENTYCPNCKQTAIERFGYDIQAWRLDQENKCMNCGYQLPIIGSKTYTAPEERYAPVIFPPFDLLHVCEGLSSSGEQPPGQLP